MSIELCHSTFVAICSLLSCYSARASRSITKRGEEHRRRGPLRIRLAPRCRDRRHLDWNLYARLDRLFIRLFQEEEDLHFYVLIDNSLSMDFGTPSKLHYARQVAAALAFIGLVNMDRVVIEAFNDKLDAIAAGGAWPQVAVAPAGLSAKAEAGGAEQSARIAEDVHDEVAAARGSSCSSAT